MIKRILISDLKVGMYISDLNSDWIPHSNFKKKGKVKQDEVIEKIKRLGIKEIYIDTFQGIDVKDAPTAAEIDTVNEAKLAASGGMTPMNKPKLSLGEEMLAAQKVHQEAVTLVDCVLGDVKMGKAIELGAIDHLAENMLNSLYRNHNALACLGCIREKDSYLMEHSVNLSVLMAIFGKSLHLDRSILQQTIAGALLHDIGKIMVPDEILHKPGKLTDEEFTIMKSHVVLGQKYLCETEGISTLTIQIAAEHHERMDGNGYPCGLKGYEISSQGRMAAIVDVYDAITADRCYHKGMTPTMAIKRLLEWSDHHLDRSLVNHFIRCIGIYPIGSLVLLESGRLGAVVEVNEFDQRSPRVRVMYHTKFKTFIKTELIDLAKPSVQDSIVKAVNPEDFRISVKDFLS
ncbi:MAG: putative nucleotidyltransferase with HDIG domain [Oleiphilaceae bacterium]|jgi:putative nucleotidyltransferase with HDIG domain